ncbi:hypothetical protein CASFOL_028095 [Castilleja foliolosa]|uniref:Exopolyphosphatase n=1 Tax=Castilleja foliolosa TaxID=1961234 RepID=A0ABD3CEH2_9LAMI
MSTGLPIPPSTTTTRTTSNDLFAAVDLGTNSFKLTVVRADPSSGRFLTLNRLKEPVLLGLDTTTTSSATTISAPSIDRAISAIRKFQYFLTSQRLRRSQLRLVATSAVREASNNSQFINAVNDSLGLNVEIISGDEEARLIYLGALQFLPVFSSTVLTIDIGGGSTEFTVGYKGNVLFSISLRLGHVILTQQFSDIAKMRDHIFKELETSGLIEKIKEFKIDIVIGSSGTIKAIEKAVCKGYAHNVVENIGVFDEFLKRNWRFTRDELRCLLERLCDEESEMEEKVKRVDFFKRRAPFILAGSVLLDEILDRLAIEVIEVSGYALGEGMIVEMLGCLFEGFDLNANARWRSIFSLASRFNNKKRMKAATTCLTFAREIFEGLRKSNEVLGVLNDRDLEYLDAANLLHNIGIYTGKKGYHKQSYFLIMNGDHLHGYTKEEIELIAMLVRYHRKKFPKRDVLRRSGEEVKQKFRILCTILRVACALQQCLPVNFQFMELSHNPEGSNLVLCVDEPLAEDLNVLMEKELEHFRMVFKQDLHILVSLSTS